MVMTLVTEGKDVAKVVNYTPEQIAIIRGNIPMDWNLAKVVGKQIGKSPKSIVSKVKNLGLEYVSLPTPTKKIAPETKAQIVAEIEAITSVDLTGLSVASVSVLVKLRTLFQAALSQLEVVENSEVIPVE